MWVSAISPILKPERLEGHAAKLKTGLSRRSLFASKRAPYRRIPAPVTIDPVKILSNRNWFRLDGRYHGLRFVRRTRIGRLVPAGDLTQNQIGLVSERDQTVALLARGSLDRAVQSERAHEVARSARVF